MAAPSPQEILGLGGSSSSGTPTPEDILGLSNRPKTQAPKKSGGHGFLHFVKKTVVTPAENLGKDIGQTAVGIAPGLYEIGKATVLDEVDSLHGKNGHRLTNIGKGIVKQYRDYYGHDVGSHLYNHPLQPIVDALTVVGGGAGAAGKLGEATGSAKLASITERGSVVTRSPRRAATGKGPQHVDLTSTAPITKGVQKVAEAARRKAPEGVRVPGTQKRIGGEMKAYGKQIQQHATQTALGKATAIEPYVKATKRLRPDEWAALHIRAADIHPDDLADLWRGTRNEATLTPKVRDLVLNPSKRMQIAEPAIRQLSEEGAKLFKEQGRLSDEAELFRPDLTKQHVAEALGRKPKEITGDPYYFPHKPEEVRAKSPFAAEGGGKGVPRKPGTAKKNTGFLFTHGKVHLRTDLLGPEFLRRVTLGKYDEVHNALVRGSMPVTRDYLEMVHGGQLPQGWEFVRPKASTKIPGDLRSEGVAHTPLDQLVPNAHNLQNSPLAAQGFTTTDINQALTTGKKYFIVPKSTSKAATGEFTKSNEFVHTFLKKPLAVWRAAVLGLRVGFLTNNLVGNSIMYSVRTGGQGALRDLFGAILETHGREAGLKVLNSKATPPELRRDLYKEFFPEQTHGTFGLTQSPATERTVGGKVTNVAKRTTGALPKLTSKLAEEYPRRALVRHFIRKSPEFKAVYAQMPRDTRTFEAAARKLLEGKGGKVYQRAISKQVNRALGDYLGLSPFERNVLRNTLPFYAWYKAIVTTTAHLATDAPLRANILGQIGAIGNEKENLELGDVPSFLRGAIGLGQGKDGTIRVLSTQGANPYATLEQLRRGGTEDLQSLGLNPFVAGLLDAYAKGSQNSGQVGPGSVVAKTLASMMENLPISRVAKPKKPSRLYPNRDRTAEALSFLGVPIKEYDPHEAAYQKSLGR